MDAKTKKNIRVLKAFYENRSGRQYQPGELVTDAQWHKDGDVRAEAYAARGLVEIEIVPAEEAAEVNHE